MEFVNNVNSVNRKERNGWKVFCLILILLNVVTYTAIYEQRTETYNFGEVEVNRVQFEDMADVATQGAAKTFAFCEIDSDECVKVTKLE